MDYRGFWMIPSFSQAQRVDATRDWVSFSTRRNAHVPIETLHKILKCIKNNIWVR